ncbi:MAG: glycosyl transferase family 2 [Candidatus Saccharibacteria bacterium]|nr:glycosyl transferase family 2 [Candidatus Saccharibacteria bacterium]
MKTSNPFITFVIPVYNEEGNLLWHYEQVTSFAKERSLKYELVYINDGSRDRSLEILKDLCKKDSNAHFISFSRNFGKEAALTAGLRKAKGDAVVCLDGDGQYPLETVDTFLEEWRGGAQLVIGVRGVNPTETIIQRLGSRAFYTLLKFLDSQQEVVSKSTDFRLIDRRVVDEFNKLTERNRVARNLMDWLGFKRVYVPFNALERYSGVASYSFKKRLKLALDGMIKHSTAPLKFIGILGMLVSFLSILAATLLIVEKYILGDPLGLAITGTAILALLLSFLVGIVLVCQGLLALYLENVYHETQNRPLFIINEEE